MKYTSNDGGLPSDRKICLIILIWFILSLFIYPPIIVSLLVLAIISTILWILWTHLKSVRASTQYSSNEKILDAKMKEVPYISMEEIDKMNGYDFEDFVGMLYRTLGYSVQHTPLSGDQGADLILFKFGEKIAVQTKRYDKNVSNKAIQEVFASKAIYDCTRCMVVTNSYYTQSAIELSIANNVELIDRDYLRILIHENLKGKTLKNSLQSCSTIVEPYKGIDFPNKPETIFSPISSWKETTCFNRITTESDKRLDFLNTSELTSSTSSTWNEITRFKGNYMKNTETFHIPSNEWKISWDTRSGNYGDSLFSISLYTSDGSIEV